MSDNTPLMEHSAMAIVICQGKILATTELVYGKIRLSLPKGHLEANETALQCAVRECYEETDITITSDNHIATLDDYTVEFSNNSNQLICKTITPLVFVVPTPTAAVVKEERILDVQWLDIADFVERCSYGNVVEIVLQAQCLISKL